MIRKIIQIDEEKCNGCGACADACHEGAIQIVDGKAKLIRDDYCDGLGDCLPSCPTGAITFVEREAAAYDEEAVKKHMETRATEEKKQAPGGCPGRAMRALKTSQERSAEKKAQKPVEERPVSELRNWPVQIKLAPVNAPYFDGAKLLVAADCSAYAYANMHDDFMKGKVTLIGCPKLDAVDYSEKLEEIIKNNDIKSVQVVRMEVPCCGGIEAAVKNALMRSGKFIPWQVVTLSLDGEILDQ